MNNCTVLIPTHDRPVLLERCVNWFRGFGYPVVIADSSAQEWQSERRVDSGVTYLQRPGGFEVYLGKLDAALAMVQTPLVVMCADDDFISQDGLQVCTAFLQQNPDYAFAQGYSYLYQVFGQRVVAWPMPYFHHEIPAEYWLDRVEQAKSTVYYGVQRTENLRAVVSFLKGLDFGAIAPNAVGLFDFALTVSAAKCGKFRRLSVPFGIREYSPHVSAVGTRHRLIVSHKLPDYYAALRDFLVGTAPGDLATEDRLLRLFARDFANQIVYDSQPETSKKDALLARGVPAAAIADIEWLYRRYTAFRLFRAPKYRGFADIFRTRDYSKIVEILIQNSGAAR